MKSRSKTQRLEFTSRRQLEQLPLPAARSAVIYDAISPKLALVIRASGARTFYAIIWSNLRSRTEWLKLGAVKDLSVDQARKEVSKIVGRFAAGEDPAHMRRDARRQKREEMTLGDGFKAYVADRKARKMKSIGDAEHVWTRCLGAPPQGPFANKRTQRSKHPKGVNWENRKLSEITHEDILRLHAALSETPNAANRVVGLISVIYNHLRLPNPATGIRHFKVQERSRFLRKEELPSFYTALAADKDEDFRDFVNLSLLTGARRANVLGMRFQDIDFSLATLTIPDAQSKNGEEQAIPLLPQAMEILIRRRDGAKRPAENGSGELKAPAAAIRDGVYVFPASSKSGHMTPPAKKWRALLQRANLSNLRLHDLRRSMGSWQAIMGASLPIIGRSLSHRSTAATRLYARLSVDPVRESMQRAAAAMMTAGEVKPMAEVKRIKESA